MSRIVVVGLSATLLNVFVCWAEPPISPDKPNEITFPAESARYVRFVIQATHDGGQACIDEIEVYGKDADKNLALGAKASASSCIQGYSIHKIENLNDGEYGNSKSWIAAGTGEEWAQIELPEPAEISCVVFSRDRNGVFRDRVPVKFEIRLSQDGNEWKTVKTVSSAIKDAPVAAVVPSPPPPPESAVGSLNSDPVRAAFLGEEHAWLKTYGRADISPALVPYNGRVKEYPRHVGDDCLPLPTLAREPVIGSARLEDAGASCGVVRVADPYDIARNPLVTSYLWAGRYGDDLFLVLEADRLLSRNLAVISSGDSCGVIEYVGGRLRFNTYKKTNDKIEVASSVPVAAAFNHALTRFEFKLPMALFPNCAEKGLHVGLGMGGKHTSSQGRPIDFTFAPLAISAYNLPAANAFAVRMRASEPMAVKTNLPDADTVTLQVGKDVDIPVKAEQGPIGPQFDLKISDKAGHEYALHLFQYDPVERTLALMDEMMARFEAKGINVGSERAEAAKLRTAQHAFDRNERDLAYRAHLAKRKLMFRDPDLKALEEILYVKRHAFRPSHNYSDYFDAPYRPGGGIYRLHMNWSDQAGLGPSLIPQTKLFDAGDGIARNPAATFDLDKVYFGYRASEQGYYHVMAMKADGTNVRQLTDGPFQDFWPCPLPGGDLAFISTRCTSRVFCWRPQSSTLFRMDANGGNIRPLSLSNITEWAPSMMSDGRIIWTRWEYIDKGADFGHTLWSIRPDGEHPELVFGNDIIQPNGYANGREVPGVGRTVSPPCEVRGLTDRATDPANSDVGRTVSPPGRTDSPSHEIVCTLISHFGDLNGPIALLDTAKGRSNPKAITCLTPEVPWPGAPPMEECFREAYPVSHDYFLCSHAPRKQFGIYVIDRYGNRELIYMDPETSDPEGLDCMCPTVFQARTEPPRLANEIADMKTITSTITNASTKEEGEFVLSDVYAGLEPTVARGMVKYIRVVEEVQHRLELQANGEYPKDHEAFFNFYASPVDKVNGPYGWPAYVAKASLGLVPVEADGSAHFRVPAGKVLYFEALDKDFNELQRMRSVIQLQPGEKRSCIGCHESRQLAPPLKADRRSGILAAFTRSGTDAASTPDAPSWGAEPFDYTKVVQPVLDAHCVQCHNGEHPKKLDFRGALDEDKVPASYRTLITKGLVHYVDCGWNSGGCELLAPMTFGSLKSKLWQTLNAGHHDVQLTPDEVLRIKTWTDLNCPLWGNYMDRDLRPGEKVHSAKK